MEAKPMRDEEVRVITTAEVDRRVPVVVPKPEDPALETDLLKALRASFARNEAAYRYLGR